MKIKPLISTPLILIPILFVLTSGCLDMDDDEGVDTVAISILPQKEMVQSIAGPEIKVITMIPAGQSPHDYSPTPGQLIDLVDADLYFKMGSGVEFETNHLGTIEETNPSMRMVDLSRGIEIKSFDEHYGSGHHEDEHDHEGTDPHMWLSPYNMKKMAGTVLEALVEEDPDNEDTYRDNHDEYIRELDGTIEYMEEKLGPHTGKRFLTYHPAWGYFGDDFQLIQIAIEEEGKKPGPQGISSIIDQAKDYNITVIFVSSQFDSSSAQEIADEIGGEVVEVNSLAEDYMDNLEYVTGEMEKGLS